MVVTGGMGYTVPVTLVDGALGRTEQELTSAVDAALYIADGTLADGPIGQVGLELEAHCFDCVDPARRPSWDRIAEVIACLPALPGDSRVTVEPGGAVELSGPPAAGVLGAVTAMQTDRAVVREHFARAGLGLLLLGADPLRAPRRIHPGAATERWNGSSRAAEPAPWARR